MEVDGEEEDEKKKRVVDDLLASIGDDYDKIYKDEIFLPELLLDSDRDKAFLQIYGDYGRIFEYEDGKKEWVLRLPVWNSGLKLSNFTDQSVGDTILCDIITTPTVPYVSQLLTSFVRSPLLFAC